MKRFRGGLVFQAHRLCVSLNSRLESNKEEEEGMARRTRPSVITRLARSACRSDSALEATQGQMDGFLGQLPYKCYLEEVASVGD